MTFEEAIDYALTLPNTERSMSYHQPCVKANGNGFLFAGHEPHEAFALHMETTTKQILLEAHPETFFVTAHYLGYPIVLVRYDGADDDLVRVSVASTAGKTTHCGSRCYCTGRIVEYRLRACMRPAFRRPYYEKYDQREAVEKLTIRMREAARWRGLGP